MTQWEYIQLSIYHDSFTLGGRWGKWNGYVGKTTLSGEKPSDILNQVGARGWELVTCIPAFYDDDHPVAPEMIKSYETILKRPITK